MDRTPAANRLKWGGGVVALVGFLLTRYFVISTLRMELPLATFLVGELPFLLGGLGLSALGVVLIVGDRRRATVQAVARWCLLGVGAVFVVVFVTLQSPVMSAVELQSRPLVSRFLVAGAVAGSLTGYHSSQADERRRELSQRADRQVVLNRLLRHEVLNKLTVVRGYAQLDHSDAAERVERNADRIEDVIDQIGFLAEAPADVAVVDIATTTRDAVSTVQERYPQATIRLVGDDTQLDVRAVSRIETAIEQLVTNAVDHTETEAPTVTVHLDADVQHVRVAVADDGPGLPTEQESLLRDRSLPQFDDPTTGFGLALVRLLLDESNATASVTTDGGTTITLTFARAYDGAAGGVALERLTEATAAAMIAGVFMGGLLSSLTGTMPVIGSLYGVSNAVIGWIVHLFHSVVFGVAFASAVWPPRWRARLGTAVWAPVAGVVFSLVLTLFAAGIVMPLWLQAVGFQVALPNLSFVGLLGHLLWGGMLGTLLIQFHGFGDWLTARLGPYLG